MSEPKPHKTWAEMTEEEQRDISFRAMNGEPVQLYAQFYGWAGWDGKTPFHKIPFPIRIRPEPKRGYETVHWGSWGFTSGYGVSERDTYRVTFDTLDDKLPVGTYVNENGDIIPAWILIEQYGKDQS